MKLTYKGREIEVEEVDVVTSNEPWNEYQLSNGKVLGVKTVLMGVFRAVAEMAEGGGELYYSALTGIMKKMPCISIIWSGLTTTII